MSVPFGMKRLRILLWRSLISISYDEYGCAKYIFVLSFSSSASEANSSPRSAVSVLKIFSDFFPKSENSCLISELTALAAFAGIFRVM